MKTVTAVILSIVLAVAIAPKAESADTFVPPNDQQPVNSRPTTTR